MPCLGIEGREHDQAIVTATCAPADLLPMAIGTGVAYGGDGAMNIEDHVGRGRSAYDRMAWRETFEAMTAAGRDSPLEARDTERAVIAGYLLGRDDAAGDILARAYERARHEGDVVVAARAAFWLGFALLSGGESAQGGAWLARAQQLLEGQPATLEHGYLRLTDGLASLDAGDWSTALATLDEVDAFAGRFDDADLATLATLGRGQALIGSGETATGMATLDQAMVAVTAGEVSPLISGIVY
jgi:hypothetical protein